MSGTNVHSSKGQISNNLDFVLEKCLAQKSKYMARNPFAKANMNIKYRNSTCLYNIVVNNHQQGSLF